MIGLCIISVLYFFYLALHLVPFAQKIFNFLEVPDTKVADFKFFKDFAERSSVKIGINVIMNTLFGFVVVVIPVLIFNAFLFYFFGMSGIFAVFPSIYTEKFDESASISTKIDVKSLSDLAKQTLMRNIVGRYGLSLFYFGIFLYFLLSKSNNPEPEAEILERNLIEGIDLKRVY